MVYNNFLTECKLFDEAFREIKDKKIVLYGLGRRTVSIISMMKEYSFVGLMDKEPDNIGKIIYGIPVLSEMEAEDRADVIIINTAEAYWETIYKRISGLKIPIFFRNGQRASLKENKSCNHNLEYWNTSYEELQSTVTQYDIISFDIFDTLIMRKVYSPEDVFRLMDLKLDMQNEKFSVLRSMAVSSFNGREYTLDELYDQIQIITNWSVEKITQLKQMEMDLEQSIIVPRKRMIELFLDLQKSGKELYLVSDMYLPNDFILKLLHNVGINLPMNHVIISGEIKFSKREGRLWEYYRSHIVNNKTAIHIGDDKTSDIINPQKYGIAAYYIMSASEMLRNSSLGEIEPFICGLYESLIMGTLCAKLFDNPFQLNESKGNINFKDFKSLGYCWYGNIILTYLLWTIQQASKLKLHQFLFLARDGYFLLEDFNYLIHLYSIKESYEGIYLPVSRRLIMIASIDDESSFEEAMTYPYMGTWGNYLEDRFHLRVSEDDIHKDDIINASADTSKIRDWLVQYKEELQKEIKEEKENYINLLNTLRISANSAVLDIGYYGHIQHYLNKLMNCKLPGLYFSADLSSDNPYGKEYSIKSCFQNKDDLKATSCYIHKQSLVLESFLTAPYGMIKKIDTNGNWICDEKKKSQELFEDRIEINNGVKGFIKDFIEIMKDIEIDSLKLRPEFADKLFGTWIENGSVLSQRIKDSFYWDNGMVQRRESIIFE
jgi:FMN phosphatase YigB (HAD superfamily)